MINLKDEEKPGVLVMVRVLEVISSFIGKKPDEILKHHIFDCKRFNAKIKPMRIGNLSRKIEDLEKNLEDNLFEELDIPYIKKVVRDCLFTNYKKSREDFIIELLVPFDKRIELNDLNRMKILKHYYTKFISLSNKDFRKQYFDFVFRGENHSKYQEHFNNNIMHDIYYSSIFAPPYLENFKSFLAKYSKK